MEFIFGQFKTPVLRHFGGAIITFAVVVRVLVPVNLAYVRAVFIVARGVASIVKTMRLLTGNHNVFARTNNRRRAIPVVRQGRMFVRLAGRLFVAAAFWRAVFYGTIFWRAIFWRRLLETAFCHRRLRIAAFVHGRNFLRARRERALLAWRLTAAQKDKEYEKKGYEPLLSIVFHDRLTLRKGIAVLRSRSGKFIFVA